MLELYESFQNPIVSSSSSIWTGSMRNATPSNHVLLWNNRHLGVAQSDILPGEFGPVMIHGMTAIFLEYEDIRDLTSEMPLCAAPNGHFTKSPVPYSNIHLTTTNGFGTIEQLEDFRKYNTKYESKQNTIAKFGEYFLAEIHPWLTIPQYLECEVKHNVDPDEYFGNYTNYVCVDASYRGMTYKFKIDTRDRGEYRAAKNWILRFRDDAKTGHNYVFDKPSGYFNLNGFVADVTAGAGPSKTETISVTTDSGQTEFTARNLTGQSVSSGNQVIVQQMAMQSPTTNFSATIKL